MDPTATQFHNSYVSATGATDSQVRHMMHGLRQENLIRNGGRGRPPAELSARDRAAIVVLPAIAGGQRVAAPRVPVWLAATATDGSGITLADVLAEALDDPLHDVASIRIDRHAPRATVETDTGHTRLFAPPAGSGDWPVSAATQEVYVISGAVLSTLALADRETGGGWVRPQ